MVLSGVLSGCVGMRLRICGPATNGADQPVRLQVQLGQYREASAAIPASTPSDNNFLLDRLESGRLVQPETGLRVNRHYQQLVRNWIGLINRRNTG